MNLFTHLQTLPTLQSIGRYAHDVNHLMLFLLSISVFFSGLIAVCIVVFVFKYRRTAQNLNAREVKNQTWVEVTWTAVPLLLTILIFFWGAKQFIEFDQTPEGSQTISVLARQWMWKFRSFNGIEEINELHLPMGRTFQLRMISQDVIHSFFIPDLRVKYDVLPNRYTQIWIEPDQAGEFPILCTQYCGTDHSKMIARLIVMNEADYKAWASSQQIRQETAPTAAGEKLFEEKACASCHTHRDIGPRLQGLAGREVQVWINQKLETQLADDDYLRESILNPAHAITQGFANVMPSYKGQLSEDEISKLIDYIKSLKPDSSSNSKSGSGKTPHASPAKTAQGDKP